MLADRAETPATRGCRLAFLAREYGAEVLACAGMQLVLHPLTPARAVFLFLFPFIHESRRDVGQIAHE